jgi:hypothetical protein
MTHPSGRFHRCTCVCPARVGRVGELGVGALPVPDLAAGVPGVAQDRRHRTQGPGGPGAVRVPPGGSAADGHGTPASFSAGDPGAAVPGQPLREHPRHHVRRGGVGLEAVGPSAPGGVGLVRMRSRVAQPVPVRGPAAEVPALVAGLGSHCGADPDAGPGDLPLRREAQHRHRLLVMLGGVIHPAARFGQPQLYPVVLEQRRHRRVLGTVERPLVLPDDDRIPAPARIRERGGQGGGSRAERPRQHPALPDVESHTENLISRDARKSRRGVGHVLIARAGRSSTSIFIAPTRSMRYSVWMPVTDRPAGRSCTPCDVTAHERSSASPPTEEMRAPE